MCSFCVMQSGFRSRFIVHLLNWSDCSKWSWPASSCVKNHQKKGGCVEDWSISGKVTWILENHHQAGKPIIPVILIRLVFAGIFFADGCVGFNLHSSNFVRILVSKYNNLAIICTCFISLIYAEFPIRSCEKQSN